ncbi:FAD binding domain-containing protein [Shewanella eurypsychrophilus]|uniref:FAD binding domain-containing protein n=1 Tax=Shewanella eurypsychrophilus TaxID=2593656 RepID=A0ABX6V7Q2_9GAMM|nr:MULTISPECIES: FAD binding domain-containing protein [Shewanella]QFU22741.1 dehydrogenase [Shewanella sp. YLB-09]QPG58030.1 FAD binding domain-containing protein [Shewanella eurypsychrophilus]
MVIAYRPETTAQAVEYLARGDVAIFAGGTDIMVGDKPVCRSFKGEPSAMLFIDAIDELKTLSDNSKTITVGAGLSLTELENDHRVPKLLRDSILQVAAPGVRNCATMGGNVCNASPAADTLPILYLLDTQVVVSSVNGKITFPIEQFIKGPGITQLTSSDLLTQLVIPKTEFSHTFYRKVGTRCANALTKVSIVGAANIQNGLLSDWRVAFGAVGPTVVRDQQIESLLIGKPVAWLKQHHNIQSIIEAYKAKISPLSDQRSTATYRLRTSLKLLEKWLTELSDG